MTKPGHCSRPSTSRSASNGSEKRKNLKWQRPAQSRRTTGAASSPTSTPPSARRSRRSSWIRASPIEERFRAQLKLAALPRNSAKIRIRNRCEVTGRPRAYYRKLKMSRIALRDLGNNGQIPGLASVVPLQPSWQVTRQSGVVPCGLAVAADDVDNTLLVSHARRLAQGAPPGKQAQIAGLAEARAKRERRLAPRAGLEPATLRLTAGCSAIELPRIRAGTAILLQHPARWRGFRAARSRSGSPFPLPSPLP